MKKVLIIEDEQNLRETLSDLLEINCYEVMQARDGNEGIEKALNLSPDLILCDINMPGKNGYEVLRELREVGCLTTVPFIFITAKATMEELRVGMESGADDYLTKPFSQESLIKAIKIAEEKKGFLINQLNELQNQLNLERLRLKDIDHLNSHGIRSKLSIIQSLFPFIRSGDIALDKGLKLIEESGIAMEEAVKHLSDLTNEDSGERNATKQFHLPEDARIWLIDDDAAQNLLTKIQLGKINHRWSIKSFQEGSEALDGLEKSEAPDLIFLDINMPGMDGFQFLENLNQRNIEQPVVMLSSSISSEDITRSMNHPQVINYFTKPLKKETIIEFLT